MSKLRALVLSCFASGFGICSIVFAIFTLINEVNFSNILRLVLTGLFLAVNIGFTLNYYSLVAREIHGKNRATRGEGVRYR
ncbi:MAG: hypothetical protein SXA11_02840 [Cyanobacteriota bacterium]|nr:hypothetical protein [Cyanobacteriota bacterium]